MEPISLIASAIPGIAKGIASLFGGRKRRRRERAAQKAVTRGLEEYKAYQFTNPYKDIENTFEDLRVATEAAEFQAQQQQQGLSQTLDALRGAGGGTGAAAVAQALAQSQARSQQQIAADLALQEAENERLARDAEMQLQQLQAQGEDIVSQREFERMGTVLGMQQQELAGAQQARAQARADLGAGIGAIGGLAAGGAFKGIFGKGNTGAYSDFSSFTSFQKPKIGG